jgi:integrase
LILAAARTDEVRLATWDEIQDDVWIIPAQRMKAGKEHHVALSNRATQLLGSLSRDGGPYLFPGPLSNSAMWKVMRGLDPRATVHGFRSSFRDWAGVATRFPRDLIEEALAHAIGPVEGAYRREPQTDKRLKLMEAWAAYLAKPPSAEVVPLRARA